MALAAQVRTGERSATEVVAGALQAARDRSELGAFWFLADERALGRAAELDDRAGLPLAGVPLAVKDAFDVEGLPTTAGLRAGHRRAHSDAAAVRLLERAGAVTIGKSAMDPLAWTTHGQADGFPVCLNPLDHALSPGGSSAGSAVAVAAGIVPLGLGTDTAGSIRIPAAYCGVVGLKPRAGEVSLDGCLALSRSYDTAGVLARTVGECAAAYAVLVGRLPSPAAGGGRIGVLADLFEACDPGVSGVCRAALDRLRDQGVRLEEVVLGWSARGMGLVLAYELAQAWGTQAAAAPGRFPVEIVSAIERARTIPAARYEQARDELGAAREELERRLGGFTALLSPTVPIPVPTLEEEDVAVSTRFTRIFNALGWAALSVPCGRDAGGRPVGMHVASAGTIEPAISVAALLEQ
jgi:aspartyl-tRNA(Asn)/glutamyl-tRNA(Gln) amidotransferase subunit A